MNKVLGIMQPYFFPYIGYYDLINYSNQWIVFDTVQYIRHGWINRNRIHHPKEGDLYITVPIKKCTRDVLIKDVIVSDDKKWKNKIIGQLEHYKKKSPYFEETYSLVKDCLSIDENRLSRLNVKILEKTCSTLGIELNYKYFSEMNLELENISGPGDWALRISEKLKIREYVNPPGGKDIFEPEKFKTSGIELTIRNIPSLEYSCGGYDYIPNLSIIDVLMFNSPEEIKTFLDMQKLKNLVT